MLFSSRIVDFFIDNILASMAIVNVLFFFLAILVFYKLVFEIYKDSKTAFFASALLFSNYYIINIYNAFIADMGGRFFLLLTNLLVVKYFLSSRNSYYYLAILSASIGVFFKEFGGLGLISLLCLILFLKINWKEKLKKIILAGVLFSISPFIYHLWFYLHFDFSYFDWYKFNIYDYTTNNVHGLAIFVKVMGWLFLAGWPFFLWGLWKEYQNSDIKRKMVLIGLITCVSFFFAWPVFMQRTAFVLVPWLSMIAGYGLGFIKNKYLPFLLLVIYLIINYNIERLLSVINLPF